MATAKTRKPSSKKGERGRRALVVCGMHRSGTSAFTRVFSLLGAELPRKLVEPAPDNPRGYWESSAIVELNDRILSSAHSAAIDPFAIAPEWFDSEEALAFHRPARALLEREFGVSPLFVLKDPRISRLLPIWLPALEGIGAESAFVLALRNPLEVAESMRLRNGFSAGKSVMLWLRHLLEAERATRLYRRTFVSFDAFIDDWRSVAEQVARDLELTWPRSCEEAQEEVDAFLSRELRHHSFTPGDLEIRTEIVDWIRRAYEASSSTVLEENERRALLDSIAAELAQADKAFDPITCELRSQVVAQEDALSRLQATLSDREEQLKEMEQMNVHSVSRSRESPLRSLGGSPLRFEPQNATSSPYGSLSLALFGATRRGSSSWAKSRHLVVRQGPPERTPR